MAVPKENSLSLGHLMSRGQDTLTRQRDLGGKNSEVIYLQQRLKVLKEREHVARQQNRQLLQQFDEAQDTLKEMLASITAMKMIRIEYEKYLQEKGPYWQQQLKEKTRSAHEKRMKDHFRPNLKNDEVTKSREAPFSIQDFQNTAAPQEQSNYSRESWLSRSQPQPAGPPIRSPYQSFNSSQVPPFPVSSSVFPHFHPFPHHNYPRAPSHQKPWSVQDTQTSLQAEELLSQIIDVAGIASAAQCLLGRLNTAEPPPERKASSSTRKEEISSASSSKRERDGGSRSNSLCQELDDKPVRLSSAPADSGESGRNSSLARSKRKRGGKARHSSDRSSSKAGSTTCCSPVIAAVTAGQSSESDAPSHKSSGSSTRMRSGAFDPGHENLEKVESQGTRFVEEDSESPSEEGQQVEVEAAGVREKTANEKVGNKNPEDKSRSCEEESGSQEEEDEEEESGSDSLKIENGTAVEVEKEEKSSSESSSKKEEENIKKNHKVDGGPEDSQEETEDVKLEEEDEDEDEMDARGDDDDHVNQEIASISSRNEVADENVDAGSEEEEEESEEESEEEEEEDEEPRSPAGGSEEDRDSEDSIISPQENRQKQIHVVPEEAGEDDEDDEEEEESKKESSDGDSNSFSDIETLLAPQAERNEETNIQKSEEESAEICDKVQVFQVKQYMKSDHQSDSDEFDHFYD